MRKLAKRILTGFMCMGLAASCMIPVSAADAHVHYYKVGPNERTSVSSYNAAQHTLIVFQQKICSCGSEYYEQIAERTESHNLIYTEIKDEPGVLHYSVHSTVLGFHYVK